MQLSQVRNTFTARRTPGRPEFNHYYLVAVIFETKALSIKPLAGLNRGRNFRLTLSAARYNYSKTKDENCHQKGFSFQHKILLKQN
jgi:hypothetical protein